MSSVDNKVMLRIDDEIRAALTVSAAQYTQVMASLVADYHIDPLQTLENGARAAAQHAATLLHGEVADRPVVVVAHADAVGAAGLAAARHLLNRGAWVQLVLVQQPEMYRGQMAHQLATLNAMHAPISWAEEGWELPPADLVVDALLGHSAGAGEHSAARELIQLVNSSHAPILSLNAPSGTEGEADTLRTPCVRASVTLMAGLIHAGLLREPAQAQCGELLLADVGIPLPVYEGLGVDESPFRDGDRLRV